MTPSQDSSATAARELTAPQAASPLWRFFSNVKVGVGLLILLASLSIIGTIIPQTTGAADTLQGYVARIGPERAALYNRLGLLSVYHSWWFNLLLVLMCTSITVASIDRWPRIYKAFAADEPIPPPSRFRGAPFRRGWDLVAAHAKVDEFRGVFSRFFGRPQVLHVSSQETLLYSNRGRWSRMGLFFVHAGILITAAGALTGNFWGFTNGQLFIREGATSNKIIILNGVSPKGEILTRPHTLPFTLRCDDFDVRFYDNPRTGKPTQRPSLFRSQLTVIDGGEPMLTRNIFVNDPLRYKGYTFYQASYEEAERQVRLNVTDNETKESYPIAARIDEPFGLAGEKRRYVVRGYEENFTTEETGPLGPAVGMEAMDEQTGETSRFLLFQKYPDFDNERGARHALALVGLNRVFFTGLQVAKDPGVWIVWTGCALMLLGMCLAFFLAHQKTWLRLTPDGAALAGLTNKQRLGYGAKVARFSQAVDEAFPAASPTQATQTPATEQ